MLITASGGDNQGKSMVHLSPEAVISVSVLPPSVFLKPITSTVINIPTLIWQTDSTDQFLLPLIFDLWASDWSGWCSLVPENKTDSQWGRNELKRSGSIQRSKVKCCKWRRVRERGMRGEKGIDQSVDRGRSHCVLVHVGERRESNKGRVKEAEMCLSLTHEWSWKWFSEDTEWSDSHQLLRDDHHGNQLHVTDEAAEEPNKWPLSVNEPKL